jgi:hypothetical protein
MKTGLRTAALVCAAAFFASCDTATLTAPPADPLMAIAPAPAPTVSVRTPGGGDTCSDTEGGTFYRDQTVCARFTFTIEGEDPETNAWFQWLTPSNTPVGPAHNEFYDDTQLGDKIVDRQLPLTTSSPLGTWTARICSDAACGSGTVLASATFTVALKPQTIDFTPVGAKTYGDAAFDLAATATSGNAVSFAAAPGTTACSVLGSSVTILAAGTCTVRASQGGNSLWAPASADQDITIGQRMIEVTADPQQKTEGDADPALSYQLTSGTSLVAGDGFSGELIRDPGEDPGVYAINQGTLTAGDNYDLHYVGASLTIAEGETSGSWTFAGFFLPVQMGEVTHKAAGATIPLGFRIFVDGVQKTTTDGIAFALVAVDCDTFEATGDVVMDVPGATKLRYAGGLGRGGAYLMNWQTPREPGCYELTMTTEGGSLSALFNLW